MRGPKIIIGFFVAIVIVLSIVRVAILNSISTTGIELVSLQNQVAAYKQENTLLKEQYLAVSSLSSIAEKAKQLGFVDTDSHIYLNTALPLALNQY